MHVRACSFVSPFLRVPCVVACCWCCCCKVLVLVLVLVLILVLVLVLSCVAHVCTHPLALTHIYLRAQVTLHRFATDDEAIAMANVTKYGLAGSVWTSDERRGYDVASRIESGILWVNCWLYAIPSSLVYFKQHHKFPFIFYCNRGL
jgi:hypothetical protein